MLRLALGATDVLRTLIALVITYYFVTSLFGLYRLRELRREPSTLRSFALVVPAHDEEKVIENAVHSLKMLDYPSDRFDVFVISDNCSDGTAERAQACGAVVYRRNIPDKRGKGFALDWMFRQIFLMGKEYDAICVFDADNLVSSNFLTEMNLKLEEGYKAVQGYVDSKNPSDSWITAAYSMAFWTSNRLLQLSRHNMGLSAQLGGTGFCISMDVLEEIGWGATCLTEDLEFSCRLILNGYRIGWAHDAVVFDEKPLTLAQSWRQRRRWMQGFSDVATRYTGALMRRAISQRDLNAFDCAMYVLQPFSVLILSTMVGVTLLQTSATYAGIARLAESSLFTSVFTRLYATFQFLFTPLVMVLDKRMGKKMFAFLGLYSLNLAFLGWLFSGDGKFYVIASANALYLTMFVALLYIFGGERATNTFIRYLLYGLYLLTWIPIIAQGLLNKNDKRWAHTRHTRAIGLHEVSRRL